MDNTYELHANGRILAFLATDLGAIKTLFPAVEARRVYVASAFDEPVQSGNCPRGRARIRR